MPKNMSIEERFFQKVNKTDSCWFWTGAFTSRGYGSFGVNGKNISAHRYSYQMHIGEIPKGLVICHKCDTPSCVNPEHLWAATQSDNMKDMVFKDRHGASSRTQTHCRKGHDFDIYGFKIYTKKNGKVERYCQECKRIADHNYYINFKKHK